MLHKSYIYDFSISILKQRKKKYNTTTTPPPNTTNIKKRAGLHTSKIWPKPANTYVDE